MPPSAETNAGDCKTTRSELDRKPISAVKRLGRALRVARQRLATTHKVSVLQIRLIEHLISNPPRRIGSPADELDVTQSTISGAVASLEEKALVERQSDPDDGRASVAILTVAGQVLADTLSIELAPVLAADRKSTAEDEAIALRVLLEEIRRLHSSGVITINRSCFSCRHYQPPERDTAAWQVSPPR